MAANRGVMFGDDARAAMRDPPREGLSRKPRTGEIDDVRIAKKIVEKRFDGVGRVRSAQLEKNYADAFAIAHAENAALFQAILQPRDFIVQTRYSQADTDLIREEHGPH